MDFQHYDIGLHPPNHEKIVTNPWKKMLLNDQIAVVTCVFVWERYSLPKTRDTSLWWKSPSWKWKALTFLGRQNLLYSMLSKDTNKILMSLNIRLMPTTKQSSKCRSRFGYAVLKALRSGMLSPWVISLHVKNQSIFVFCMGRVVYCWVSMISASAEDGNLCVRFLVPF
jgi:hypothetical protein